MAHQLQNTQSLAMEVAVACERGPRDENQDWLSWDQSPRGDLFIVADGMGGHKGGARAARTTVTAVSKHLAAVPPERPLREALQEAVRRTNQEVYDLAHGADAESENMGSTIVIAVVSHGTLQVAHVGDSRAYLYRRGQLTPLTRDHTEVQQMLDAGLITLQEAHDHPEAHVLSRAVGSRPTVDVEVGEPLALERGDALLLCSDGLSGFVGDEEIRAVLDSQTDTQRIPEALVELALAAGGSDNVTIQFVRFGGGVGMAVEPARHDHGRPAEQSGTPGRRARWLAGIVALGTAGPLVWGLMLRPTIDLTYSVDSTACEGRVQLSWVAHRAETVAIEPQVGEVPLVGSRCVTFDGPGTYTAMATGRLLRRWPVRYERTVTVPRAPATDLPADPAPPAADPGMDEPAPGDSKRADPARGELSRTRLTRAPCGPLASGPYGRWMRVALT